MVRLIIFFAQKHPILILCNSDIHEFADGTRRLGAEVDVAVDLRRLELAAADVAFAALFLHQHAAGRAHARLVLCQGDAVLERHQRVVARLLDALVDLVGHLRGERALLRAEGERAHAVELRLAHEVP